MSDTRKAIFDEYLAKHPELRNESQKGSGTLGKTNPATSKLPPDLLQQFTNPEDGTWKTFADPNVKVPLRKFNGNIAMVTPAEFAAAGIQLYALAGLKMPPTKDGSTANPQDPAKNPSDTSPGQDPGATKIDAIKVLGLNGDRDGQSTMDSEGAQGDQGSPQGPEGRFDPNAAQRAEQRGQQAMGRAGAMGDTLKNSAIENDNLAGPAGRGGRGLSGQAPGGSRAGAGGQGGASAARDFAGPSPMSAAAGAAGNLGNPQTLHDLDLAAGPYKAAFAQLGLSLGQGPDGARALLRRDGGPAGADDFNSLRNLIASEPLALLRRPDYFDVLPRDHFLGLKGAYRNSPELRETDFRHIGMSPADRDFQWSATCDRLSGDCNKHASRGHYKKGADVPPEDLKSIWNRIKKEAKDYQADSDQKKAAEERRRTLLSGSPGRLERKAGSFWESLSSFLSGGGSSGASESPETFPEAGDHGLQQAGGQARHRADGIASSPARSKRWARILKVPNAPGRQQPQSPRRSLWPWALLAALLIILVVFLSRRRRSQS